MALPDLYSRRKRQAAGAQTDVYKYDEIPYRLRQQLLYGFRDMFQFMKMSSDQIDDLWAITAKFMRREKGVSQLHEDAYNGVEDEFMSWFLEEREIDFVLDAVELLSKMSRHMSQYKADEFARGMSIINARFLESAIGYQVDSGQVIQISSQLVHSEVVVPALRFLSQVKYKTADEEFRKAHDEYRAGEYEDCLVDCLKSFESVLKVISAEKRWGTPENATAKQLIQAAYDNQLVPTYTQNEFSGLRSILEGGVPTVRNKAGGHGQGTAPRQLPQHLAAFQLHQTAAAILYFVQSADQIAAQLASPSFQT